MISHQQKETRLIPALPDDVTLSCLARVPRRFHIVLKNVCRRWRDLISSEDWYAYRRNKNLSETWIYSLCSDKSGRNHCYVLDPDSPNRSWKEIPNFPPRCLRRTGMGLQSIGKNLYLLGGCGWSEDPTSETYSFDTSINSWKEAIPLSVPRCYFACEIVSGKILAIGGLGLKAMNCSWETLDPVEGTQELHSNVDIIADVDDSVVFDGEVYLRGGVTGEVLACDIADGSWRRVGGDMGGGWRGPAVVVEDALYVLDQRSGARVMAWQKERREWLMLGRLSQWAVRENCRLVSVGRRVFAVGKGLGTVAFDVGSISGRIMVCSSFSGVADSHVLSCVAVSL